MNENMLGKKICILASELGHRIFRQNTGVGWAGKATKFTKPTKIEAMPGDVLIRNARPLHAGLCTGSPDYVGFSSTGKFIGIELKSDTGKPTEAQLNFIDAVKKSGGIAGIVRDEESAFDLLS